MNKYRKEYCEENGRVKINLDNTKLYDYIKHLENKLEQAEQLTLTDVSQQRELLKDYAKLIQGSYTIHFFDDEVEESIDEFLSL